LGKLWSEKKELQFFKRALKVGVPVEKLFYLTDDGKYYAYYPKGYKGKKTTLQSRNAYVGDYTEKWFRDLIAPIAEEMGYYAVLGVVSEELELTQKSPADVAICRTPDRFQKAEDIVMIFEVKMSIVWNWEYKDGEITNRGDFTTHSGTPSLLRSDSMLKAIGKAVNIRASSMKASKIPIIIVGNTPITKHYYKKVDNLKRIGIIQGFWSLNPRPTEDNSLNIKKTPHEGFYRFDSYKELADKLSSLLKEDLQFFGGMLSKEKLGKLIELADKEKTYEEKAQRFLELLWGERIDKS